MTTETTTGTTRTNIRTKIRIKTRTRIKTKRRFRYLSRMDRHPLRSLYTWPSRHLTLLVFIALVAAVLLGQFAPATAIRMRFLGDRFVDVIKVFIPFIIFLTIVSGISGMNDLKKVGRIGIKALVYFEVVTTLSLAIGILLAYLVQPGRVNRNSLPAGKAPVISKFSWSDFFAHNLTLQVLLLAIIAGIILSLHPRRQKVLPY